MKMMAIALLAGVCAFASAVELVLNRHDSRRLFVELQTLRLTKQELDQQWGQLLLEQATWATHARVEEIAHDALGMVSPRAARVVELR